MCALPRRGPSAIERGSRCFIARRRTARAHRMFHRWNGSHHVYSRIVTKRTGMWITSHFAGVNDMNRHLMIAGAVPIYGSEAYP